MNWRGDLGAAGFDGAGGGAAGCGAAGGSVTAAPDSAVPYVDARAVLSVSYTAATDALRDALRAGLDPAAAPARGIIPVAAGQLLLMPAEVGSWVGVKIASVAPANPARGRPRIQGSFLLMDADTLVPLAVIDGIALTTLRTPAVSSLAARYLTGAAAAGSARLLVFGAGPQAEGHILALDQAATLTDIAIISRDERHAADLAMRLRDRVAPRPRVGRYADLAVADIVVCATTARDPLFEAGQVMPRALVIAVGSHEPDVRELDTALLDRAQVIVEDRLTAIRESGEVAAAVAAGFLTAADLVPLADLVTGRTVADLSRIRVFKSVGMAWEDVAVAGTVWRRRREEE